MAHKRIKTEHTGPKNGGGAWMTRAEVKQTAKRKRRLPPAEGLFRRGDDESPRIVQY
jgi:hypothetical protein